jgi:hypothetical protein
LAEAYSKENKFEIALAIVRLRGFLRHHSLGNPKRWSLHEQTRYEAETTFLGLICQAIAYPRSFAVTWEGSHASAFQQQARELGFVIQISVTISLDDGAGPREVSLEMSYPGLEPSPMLAKAVLENSLREMDRRSPGAELLGLRARVKPSGRELLRYDLGPTIPRSIA